MSEVRSREKRKFQMKLPVSFLAIALLLTYVLPDSFVFAEAVVMETAANEESSPDNAASETKTDQPLTNYSTWALLNLILTIVTGVIMVLLLVTYFFVKRKDKQEDDQDPDYKVKRYLGLRLLTVAATAIAIILFSVTEDTTLQMTMADNWTICHIIITVAVVILAIFSMKTYEEEEK